MDTPILHIQLDDDGTPRTINHRVKVKMIAQKYILGGMNISDIAEHYDIELWVFSTLRGCTSHLRNVVIYADTQKRVPTIHLQTIRRDNGLPCPLTSNY